MPVITEFQGIRIYMNFEAKEHNPPHFHATYGEYECSIDLRTCDYLAGGFPRKQERLLFAWAELHQEELLEMWKSQEFQRIPGL